MSGRYAVSWLAAVVVIAGGCAPKASKTTKYGRPAVDIPAVMDAHVFADALRHLTPEGLDLKARAAVPVPLSPGRMLQAESLSQPDLQRLRAGMSERVSSVNTRVDARVRAREMRTAEVQARQMRVQLAPELTAELADEDKRLSVDLVNAQNRGVATRQKLQVDISLLKAKARVMPGDIKAIESQVSAKEAELDISRSSVASEVEKVRSEHRKTVNSIKAAHEKRLDLMEQRLLQEAGLRAEQQAETRKLQSREAMNTFFATLRTPASTGQPSLIAARPVVTVAELSASNSKADLDREVAKIRKKMTIDAESAGILASLSYTRPKGGLPTAVANRRAKRLVSGQL